MNEKACIFLKSKLQDEYINILFKRKRWFSWRTKRWVQIGITECNIYTNGIEFNVRVWFPHIDEKRSNFNDSENKNSLKLLIECFYKQIK